MSNEQAAMLVESAGGYIGGPCDYCVTPVPIGLRFGFALGLGLDLRGPDLGLELDNIFNKLLVQSR